MTKWVEDKIINKNDMDTGFFGWDEEDEGH